MPWVWVNTEYSIHRVKHTPSTAYTTYSIHPVQHTPSTAYTVDSIHQVQHAPSTAYTKYSIHQVQHPPSTASSQDCLASLHSHDHELTPECSFSFRCASLQDRLPPASSPQELKCTVTSSHPHGCKLADGWIDFQHPVRHLSTARMYFLNLPQWWPPSGSPNSLDHGLQMHLVVTPSRPPNASPISLNYNLQVHHRVQHVLGLQVHLWVTWSRPPNASRNSLKHSLQVHLQTRSITASKCIFELLDVGLQVHHQTCSITASKCIFKLARLRPPSVSLSSLDHSLPVLLHICSITASKCISEFTWSSFSGAPQIALKHCLQPVQISSV